MVGKLRFPRRAERSRLPPVRAVRDFNRSLALIVDPEALQASVASQLRDVSGAERVVILQLDSQKAVFTPTYSLGIDPGRLEGISLKKRGRLAKWLLVNESPLVVSEAAGVVEHLEPEERHLLTALGVRACLPLVALNRLVGIVLIGTAGEDWPMDEESSETIGVLAGLAGLAFENACMYRDQRDRLRRLDRAERLAVAGEVAAGVAHEVRNPLTAIRSTVQYLIPDYPASSTKGALLRELIAEIDRIDRTVDGLLSLTRARELEPSPLDVAQLVEETLLLIAARATGQNVTIKREYGQERLHVHGDAVQLKQVFLNLAINALQAMPDGGQLSVGVRAWRSSIADSAPAWARVTFSDTGCGIAPENLEKVFDPFFTTKREGTGLGLSTCYWIVQRHDGEIDVQSHAGRGSAFTVKLPLGPERSS